MKTRSPKLLVKKNNENSEKIDLKLLGMYTYIKYMGYTIRNIYINIYYMHT